MGYNPIQTFLQEAEELLADIEQSVLALGPESSAETINCIFRAFHTLKGSGAMCGLTAVADFAHHVENLLDDAREGQVPVTRGLTDVLLAAADRIKALLAAERSGEPADAESGEKLIQQIAGMANEAVNENPGTTGRGDSEPRTWVVRFRPERSYLACGGNPVLLERDLRLLGDCAVECNTDDIPLLDEIQPDLCYLGWTFTLCTTQGEDAIRDVFLFADGEYSIEAQSNTRAIPAVRVAGSDGMAKAVGRESMVRVPAARLDRLVNLLGELVMNQSRLTQAATVAGAAELANPVQEIERLVAALRDDVLGIRMLPIGTIFGRFRRVVHDLSSELGKQVELTTEGGETELDKSILDQLGDPLVHLLRNALDHGIESPAERAQNGKPACGRVRLAAQHTGSAVVIRMEDDGRGIDRAAVRAKAIEKQLIGADASLTEKDITNLILSPGFSTARAVSSVSGRGVGMDAVKRQIDALRGSISIDSETGKGCLVSLTLPLTLAIIEGLVVQVGSDQFIIPMSAITENVELPRAQRERNNGRNVVAVRGELIPYIDVRETFATGGEPPSIEKIVIVRHEEQRVGLVVDRVLGTHQTVIQSLGRFLRQVSVVSGATIMGDGRVALILDVAAVVKFAGLRAEVLGAV